MSGADDKDLSLNMVSEIVSAYVSNNSLPTNQLSELIASVHDALMNVGEKAPEALEPAVPIKKSIKPDYLVCLEDGKKLKMLKRHIRTSYNLSPEEYRQKWGLPDDYPMVAPEYAARRSELAKKIGLGKSHRKGGGKAAA
jgi:predicted transcriptional regulator